MIKILVVEDNPTKLKTLRPLLDSIPEVSEYKICHDATEARRLLATSFYDLAILDLNIPKRFGDDPNAENSVNLIRELGQSQRLVTPSFVIGLTEFDELRVRHREDFEEHFWSIVLYEASSITWERQLRSKINYLINAKSSMLVSSSSEHQFDLAFITALRIPELDFVLKLPCDWRPFKLSNDPTEYYHGELKIEEKKFSLIAASAPQMGMVAASTLTMKLIHSFRPKYVVMTGIAAGIRGKSNYGDILISELAFDYTSGKATKDSNSKEVFQPDFKSIGLSRDLLECATSCRGNRSFLDGIKNDWVGDSTPSHSLNVHIGPIASGGSVVENTSILETITEHSRKLIGIDMETYGVYYAANNCSKPKPKGVISIKSVSDFADLEKSDNHQNYASYTSANYALKFFKDNVLKSE
ncbi:MAG: hypothetical protein ACMVP2_26025 [Imperialibacter sp.]|uniref:phosphorylase family protein n=1 Tax=Imperialibacter sp. TaxID=2038411 RepID=UPI003A8B88F1